MCKMFKLISKMSMIVHEKARRPDFCVGWSKFSLAVLGIFVKLELKNKRDGTIMSVPFCATHSVLVTSQIRSVRMANL